MSYKQAVINNTISATVICIHVYLIDSLESFVQDSDYTGCAVRILFIKRKRIIRVSCLGTTIQRLICMFWFTNWSGSIESYSFGNQIKLVTLCAFDSLKWNGCAEWFFGSWIVHEVHEESFVRKLDSQLYWLHYIHICVRWMLYNAYVCL